MALNPSIFGNMLNAPKSPEEYAAERENLLASRQANVLNRQKMDEYAKGVERQGQLRNLLAGGADSSALRQAGFLDEASNWDKNAAEVGLKKSQGMKAEAEAQHAQLKAASDRLGMIYNAASGAKDQQSYTMALQGLRAAGVDISGIPDVFDPAYVENAKSQALTQMQRVEQAMKEREFGLKQQQFGETVRHNKSTEGIQLTGIRLADSRAREATAATMSKPFEVTGADGQPVLVQQDKQGNIRPVQGYGPKPPAPSAAQQKELMSINQQRSIINGALKSVDTTPGAFTFKRGIAGKMPFGETMAGRMETPEETQARSYVFNNVSRVINERAGAAQSAQELARLNSFLPADTDGPEQIKNKLRGFAKYLDDLESGTRGTPKQAAPSNPQRTVTRTGTHNGKKVIQYSDGSIEYAN